MILCASHGFVSEEKLKQLKEEKGKFYATLITLSNHTPFEDTDKYGYYDVSMTVDGVKYDYMENTKLGNYFKSVHYADEQIGLLIEELEKENMLDDTVIVIYGDHDARMDKDEFNLLYNYDPVNDRIKDETDDGYVSFNDYDYELNKKVPFIIWTRDKNFNKTVDTPMGMIDVLPTLGNMLGIHSDYQLGNDIFNLKDNVVTFIDGSYLTSNIYYSAPKGEIYPISNDPITEEYIQNGIEHSSNLIDISNDIISYDLIKELKEEKSN